MQFVKFELYLRNFSMKVLVLLENKIISYCYSVSKKAQHAFKEGKIDQTDFVKNIPLKLDFFFTFYSS